MTIPVSHIITLLISGGAILLGLIHILMYFTTSRKPSHLLGFLAHFSMAFMLLCTGGGAVFSDALVEMVGLNWKRNMAFLSMILFITSVEYLYSAIAKLHRTRWKLVLIFFFGFLLIFVFHASSDSKLLMRIARYMFYGLNFCLQFYCFRLIYQSLRRGERQSLRLLIMYSLFVLFFIVMLILDFDTMSNSWLRHLLAYGFLVYLDSDILIRYRTEVTPTSSSMKQWSHSFTQQIKELRNSNASKDKFLSIVAHDLKNPISSLKALSDIYSEDAKSNNDPHSIELAHMMNESISSVYRLLDNLLTWARSQNSSIKYEPEMLRVDDLMLSIQDATCAICQSKNIKLRISSSGSGLLLGDCNMIQTVLRNLVTNAVKFSFPGNSIELDFGEDSASYIISVQDHGVGMSSSTIDKLFRIDEVSSSTGTQNERGTGLGLIICQEFVKKHGGSISVSSEEGLGTTFYVRLPKTQKTEDDIASPSAKKNEK